MRKSLNVGTVVDPVTVFLMRKEQNAMRDATLFQMETNNAIAEIREQLGVVARQVNALTFALEAELGLTLPEGAPLTVPADEPPPFMPGMTITPASAQDGPGAPAFKQVPVDPATGEPVITQEIAGVFSNGEPGGLFPPESVNDPEVTGAAEHPDRPDPEPGYIDDSVDPTLKDA